MSKISILLKNLLVIHLQIQKSNILDWFNKINALRQTYNWQSFHAGMLIENGISEGFFNLDVLVTKDRKVYSCNNRRLCLLKNLVKIGFNGIVSCTAVKNCSHPVVKAENPFVQKGNIRGNYCLNLI